MSDGNTLFTKALLTCARSETPRDGGAALGALADWIQERLNDGQAGLALGDSETTGFVLIVMYWTGTEFPVRLTFVMTEDPGSCYREQCKDCGEGFRKWFAKTAYQMWGED